MAQLVAAGSGAELEDPDHGLEHAYGRTAQFSVGGEEEFMLVDAATGELVPQAPAVLARCDRSDPGSVEHEVVASAVESASPVCSTAGDLLRSMESHRAALGEAALASGCRLLASGTHPFATGDQQISAGDRYAAVARDYPWVVHAAATYGLHVHVGIQGADRAIAVCNELRRWLPHLLALSANSPFLHGEATGLQSTRVVLAQLYPRSGVPPVFDGYRDYVRTIRALEVGPAVEDYTHTWWFVRPHPRYGTVELRIFDAQTDVRRSVALAALAQALCAQVADDLEWREATPASQPICEENLWAAARGGTDACFIDERRGHRVAARRSIQRLLHRLRPWFEELGSTEHLQALHAMLDCNGARAQLHAVEQGLAPGADLVAFLADRTAFPSQRDGLTADCGG